MSDDSNGPDSNLGGALWVFLALSLLVLAWAAFGFQIVGKLCTFAVLAFFLGHALLTGRFEWAFGRSDIRRDTRPILYWSLAGANALLAFLALALVIGDVRARLG